MSNGIVLYYLNVAEIQDNLERASFEIKQAPVFIALCVCMCFLRFIIYLAISSILSHFYYPCLVLSGKIKEGHVRRKRSKGHQRSCRRLKYKPKRWHAREEIGKENDKS